MINELIDQIIKEMPEYPNIKAQKKRLELALELKTWQEKYEQWENEQELTSNSKTNQQIAIGNNIELSNKQ